MNAMSALKVIVLVMIGSFGCKARTASDITKAADMTNLILKCCEDVNKPLECVKELREVLNDTLSGTDTLHANTVNAQLVCKMFKNERSSSNESQVE